MPGSRVLDTRRSAKNFKEGRQGPPEALPRLISAAASAAAPVGSLPSGEMAPLARPEVVDQDLVDAGAVPHSRGLAFRLDVTRRLVKSLAALAVPDPLRGQRWVPTSPGGQNADR